MPNNFCVKLCSYVQQHLCALRLPVGGGAVQRGPQVVVLGLDLGPGVQQEAHNAVVAEGARLGWFPK